MASGHVAVLPQEVIALLAPSEGQTVVDLTLGRGGHAALFAECIGPAGTIVGVDLDEGNLEAARERVESQFRGRFIGLHMPFSAVSQRLVELGITADAVLADLGFSSTQIDDPTRGLSFSADGPLDMRFDRSSGRTAADLLAELPERELTEMLRHLGEEPLGSKIARNVVRRRDVRPIQTTLELVSLIEEVYGPRAQHSRLHPATRTFMALRIAVNDELNRIASLLSQIADAATHQRGATVDSHRGPAEHGSEDDAGGASTPSASTDRGAKASWLQRDARIGIISFHSLEDRLVKHAFADMERSGLGERLTRKPVTASESELRANPRSRSAKLRVFKIGDVPDRAARRGRRERDEDEDE